MLNEILIINSVAPYNEQLSTTSPAPSSDLVSDEDLGTAISNLAYYGYTLNLQSLQELRSLTRQALSMWLDVMKKSLGEVTKDNRKMDDFVVYKNFPKEVLSKSQAQYWLDQVLIYSGQKVESVQSPTQERQELEKANSARPALKVLSLQKSDSAFKIAQSLVEKKTRWSEQESAHAIYFFSNMPSAHVNYAHFGFKENATTIASSLIEQSKLTALTIADATDVLRLAASISTGQALLTKDFKFKNFSRPLRKMFLSCLESSKNLQEDVSARRQTWKKFLHALHPGDYKFEKVKQVYNDLYNEKLQSFDAKVEQSIAQNTPNALSLLASRPGVAIRRLQEVNKKLGPQAALQLLKTVAPKVDTPALLKLKSYLSSISTRKKLLYAPKGQWSKVQVADNKASFNPQVCQELTEVIDEVLAKRLQKTFPSGVNLDDKLKLVKLPTNDQELSSVGRGTVYEIGPEIKFIRSASYWQTKDQGTVWFDNGWNFFDSNWSATGNVCWNVPSAHENAAIFSGDPVNTSDMHGRACQMIDLYIDKLVAKGARYAVWNILAFSGISFSKSEEVLATLQLGEKAESGKLYEPSRAQMSFALKGENLTKYIAYIDLVKRKIVYMDANLPGSTQSASNNAQILSEQMPAFVEYLEALPSAWDYFTLAPLGDVPLLYSDAGVEIEKGANAYVFSKENPANDFNSISLLESMSENKVILAHDTPKEQSSELEQQDLKANNNLSNTASTSAADNTNSVKKQVKLK